MQVVRCIAAGLVAAAGTEAEHSRDHKKKFLSKSQALATSERTDLLKTHHVFGFATDASKTKSALKAIAKCNKAAASASKSKKGVAKIGKAKKQGGMTTSAKAEAFTSGSSTLLTTCNYGATTEVCILAKKYGECVPQYITALPNGNTTDLSTNQLKTLENLPQLPFRLKKLFLIGNPLMRYVVSSDTYNRLNNVDAVTVPAMTAPCPAMSPSDAIILLLLLLKIHNNLGDTSIGALGSQRVVVKPHFSDHQMDVLTMYTTVAHPKIVSLMGETWDISGSLSIVMPFYGRGCLRSVLVADAVPLGPLSGSPVKLGLAIDATEALMFLTFSAIPLRLPGVDRGHVGMRKPWVAPEILRASSPHTPKADLYAFGVLLSVLDRGDEATNTFNGFKLQAPDHKFRYVTFKIEGNQFVVDKTGPREHTYEDFAKALAGDLTVPNPVYECRHGVIDLDCTSKDGRPVAKLVFLSWSPENASIKAKMVYSSSKEALKSVCVGVGIFINATDASELEFATVADGVSKFL
ncbi:hypothetical protein DYB34_002610 [Aphanomyces astaci]|uniref:ADF-H domain-containing protein n=1 Tax=Aphanomyces astaci TaxID=112090 RepID=A0A3R7ACJ7_APHAT|nr:hypothetical protein DYB34_002610 [Aphanomyces astaci]